MFCCCYGPGSSRRGLIIATVPWNERARGTARCGRLEDDHRNFMAWSLQAGNEEKWDAMHEQKKGSHPCSPAEL